jgi:hypothetical protein
MQSLRPLKKCLRNSTTLRKKGVQRPKLPNPRPLSTVSKMISRFKNLQKALPNKQQALEGRILSG